MLCESERLGSTLLLLLPSALLLVSVALLVLSVLLLVGSTLLEGAESVVRVELLGRLKNRTGRWRCSERRSRRMFR